MNNSQGMASMFNLPTSEWHIKYVHYRDLENFIKKVYGIYETRASSRLGYLDFNLPDIMEWDNDELHEYSVRRERLGKWDMETLDKFMRDPYNTQYVLTVLLTDMCNQGHIEEGDYIIKVAW